jgi:hypothetical protein
LQSFLQHAREILACRAAIRTILGTKNGSFQSPDKFTKSHPAEHP